MIKSIFNIPGDRRKDEKGNLVGTESYDTPIIELPTRLMVGDWFDFDTIMPHNDWFEDVLTDDQLTIFYGMDCPEVSIVELQVLEGDYVMRYWLADHGSY